MAKDVTFYCYDNVSKENMALAVYNTGYQRCKPGHHPYPGKRDMYLLHCVVSGKGIFRAERQVYHLSTNDVFIIFPGVDVYYEADSQKPWEYYWVAFNGTEARRLLEHTGFSKESPVLHLEDTDILRTLLMNIYKARGNTPEADAEMTGHLHLFLGEMMRKTRTDRPMAETVDYLTQAVSFIERNSARPIRIEEIAAAVGVSRSQLYRAFMDKFSLSPLNYLRNHRINEACALLRRNELSVANVATAVGFADPLYFSRVFREVKGISPSAYRSKHQ